jgi:hypothetical protein
MIRCAAAILLMLVTTTSVWGERQNPPAAPTPQTERADDPDLAALRADLARARSLVSQMERNIAFVDSGLTPLKHQFQLEIDMWNLLINDMQRRLNSAERRRSSTLKPAEK